MKPRLRFSKRAGRLGWIALGAAAAVVLFQVAIMPLAVKHAHDAVVPDLRGLNAAEAGSLLEQASLAAGSTNEAADDLVPAGRIVRQSPLPGSSVRRGRQIDLVVSAGPATQRVPKLTGETLFHARFLLEREGIRLGRIRKVAHRTLPADCVVAARPQPGTPVGRRATVDLLVSSGPPPERFVMPDLRGLDAQVVKQALEAAGLHVNQRIHRASRDRPGQVVEQTPPAGYPIEAGGTVEILTGG
jgi:beta-lactam-binding protein with PASTA domain